MLSHFALHKQKYISFFIIAVLVTLVAYASRKTEALESPYLSDEEGVNFVSERCPPYILWILNVRFRHPCMREEILAPLTEDSLYIGSSADTSTSTEEVLNATTTDDGLSSDTSTSTEEMLNATTTSDVVPPVDTEDTTTVKPEEKAATSSPETVEGGQ